ncbi:MAG TPA: type II secretion system protein [Candidatus Nanoarchaeia archaeon]
MKRNDFLGKQLGYKNKGFTLIELLVSTAIIGILAVVSAVVVTNILRSQNKNTVINEIRQNGDFVIAKFERDVKAASRIECLGVPPPCSGVGVTLINDDGGTVSWSLSGTSITRDDGTGAESVTSTDPARGVEVTSCLFTVTEGPPSLVTWEFDLQQGANAPGKTEFQVDEPFRVSVGTRRF